MEVKGLLLDPLTESPVLLLRSVDGKVILPIWIGETEANAIATALEGARFPRPMTHDLLHALLETLAVELPRIEVWDLREGTFFGRLCLRRGSEEILVDARPSDAVALSVRSDAAIWVAQAVLDGALSTDSEGAGEESERLREWLEKTRPEDLGKYTM
jgi:bifunctional DNase/RNase